MTPPYDPSRHEALGDAPWDEGRVRDAIVAVCRDAEAAFDPLKLWPAHPRDVEPDLPAGGRFHGLYLGAAGMLHALHRLAEAGFFDATLDGAAILSGCHDAILATPDEPGAGPSLLLGPPGALLITHRLTGSPAVADELAELISSNVENPSNEMLVGSSGTMLAARAMYGRNGEERFADLWRASATVLLSRQEPDGLWTQDLCAERLRYVGAGHGFAGNLASLWAAPEWLEHPDRVEAQALAVVRDLARVEGELASWPALAPLQDSEPSGPPRVQWCHGAPGMIISLARLGLDDERHTALLEAGGEFVWRVGPLATGAGLCHGTAGNGFAFLTLLDRTGDERWLDRARAFALHALGQAERSREDEGRGRYTLFTGDVGPALLAAACLTGDSRFPGLDDL